MAFTENEIAHLNETATAFCKRRVPLDAQAKIWMGFQIHGQSNTLLEFRPSWQDPSRLGQYPIAKTRFNRREDNWAVYWMRRDLKWHPYEPRRTVRTFEEFFAEVDRDEFGCFFG